MRAGHFPIGFWLVATRLGPCAMLVGLLVSGCAKDPAVPDLTAPRWATVGDIMSLVVSAIDPQGRRVAYRIASDTAAAGGWTDLVPSGAALEIPGVWAEAGLHVVRAQAQNDAGGASAWSGPCSTRVLPRPGYPRVVSDSIPLSGGWKSMTVTPDGAWLFAASYDGAWTRLHIIRTSDNQVTDTIVLMHGSVVSDAECSPDGRKVYVAARKLFVVDAVERRLVDSIPLETYALAFSPDGRELYAAGEFRLSVLQTANDSVVADIPFCQFPSAMVMHPDGQRLYVADEAGQRVLVVDTRARTIAATVLLPTTWPWALALASEGRLLYVAGNGLSVVNTKNNVCTDVLPFAEVAGFGLSTCARYIYYSVYNRDGILVLDTRQRVVVDTIARGIGAGSTISLPDGTRAYAEGFGGLRELTFGVWGSTVSIEK